VTNPLIPAQVDRRNRTITAGIYAADVITRVGLQHWLDGSPEISVNDDGTDSCDVYVVAVENADMSTLKLLRSLSPSGGSRFVLVLEKQWDADVTAAVEHGIRAVLMRAHLTPVTLTRAIVAVMEGDGIFPPKLQGTLMRQIQQIHKDVLEPRGLTASGYSSREVDVFRLLSEGLDLEEIARKLSYSERTVKNILYNAMKRNQLRNRTHAVSHAIRTGII
jgi:DNA-binding NarL/FixJ family response regulator